MKQDNSTGRGRRLTSAEIAKVINDPAVRERDDVDSIISRGKRLYAESARGLLSELAAAGFVVESVGQLRQSGKQYKDAVPILLDWLPRIRYLPLAEDVVRTLSVNFARKLVLPEFLALFKNPPHVEDPMRPKTSEPAREHLRWVIGNGLGILANPSVAEELICLASDRRFGAARTQIVYHLPKTKSPHVPEVLIGLLDDPSVAAFAVSALGRMRFVGARDKFRELLDHPDENVRFEAKKALKRLGE